MIRSDEKVSNGRGIIAPLEHPAPLAEGHHLVLADLEPLLPRLLVVLEQGVHQAKDLLHDSILTVSYTHLTLPTIYSV